jgi:outer membrane protein assembly factor BamA
MGIERTGMTERYHSQRFLHGGVIGCLIAMSVFASEVFAAESAGDSLHSEKQYQGIPVGQITCSGNKRTRDRVIMQEVLLQPGDPYDPELARETERNLRKLQYLGSAEVIPHYDAEREVVNLEVTVTDRWPWVALVLPSFGGGRAEVEVIFGNTNSLGMGQTVGFQAFYSNQVSDSYSFLLSEPRIGGAYWGGTLHLGRQGEVGNRYQLDIWRPLYSLSTKWAYNGSVFDWATEHLLFHNGFTVSDYYRRRRGGVLGIRRSFRKENRLLQIGTSYFYRHDTHRQAPEWMGVIPEDKRRATLTAELAAERFRFVKDSYLFLMGPVEDIKLGSRVSIRLGGALKSLGSDSTYPEMGFSLGWWSGSPKIGYVMCDANVDARFETGELTNIFAWSALRFYGRLFGKGKLAARAQFNFLEKTEDPLQLLLDSPNGLRGYEANSFDGTRRVITNLEWRQPLWRMKWVEFGTVLFADGGMIWTEHKPMAKARFLVGRGVGLRLGFPGVFSAPVLRLDAAYGVQVDSWEFSLGFGQRF